MGELIGRLGWMVLGGLVSFSIWQLMEKLRLGLVRRRIRRGAGSDPLRPVVLILSVARDIRPDVERFLAADPAANGSLIFQVHRAAGLDGREEVWMDYFERVRKEVTRVRHGGARQVHLFCNLPVAMAVLVGSALLPGPEVVLYHYQDNAYHPVGRLNVATAKL